MSSGHGIPASAATADQRETILREARAWARRLSAGSPTTQDAEALRHWCGQSDMHAQAWMHASAEWREMGEVLRTFRALHPAAPPRMRPARRRLLAAGAGAAAAAAGVAAIVRPPMGLWPSWRELGADYRTATGEQRDVDLGGSIRLALNTQTSVAVRAAAAAGPARLELIAGEAAVQAGGGAPVEVAAGAGSIRLLSGGIEVRRLGSGVRVWCTAGSAELRHPARMLTLHASQRVSYDASAVAAPVRDETGSGSAWRDGAVAFQDTPLAEAVEEINRYRPGRVMLMDDALAGRRISGRFAIGALDQAIVLIERLYQARVRRIGDVVLLG